MSSSSTQKQQRQRINNNNIQQSHVTNAYFDRNEYHQQSLINKSSYWNRNFHESNDEFYMNNYYSYRNKYSSSSRRIQKGRQIKNGQQQNSKPIYSSLSSNNNNSNYSSHAYHENISPRHRLSCESHPTGPPELKSNSKCDVTQTQSSATKTESPIKPSKSNTSSSTESDISDDVVPKHRKDLHVKHLTAAALAARQQNSSITTNLSNVQTLMNSLILQQQQSSQSQSTAQLQYQLTNALLGIMIQQRLKEATLQAQAQQIQAALPTLFAAQALFYQQQQQLTNIQQQTQSILSTNIAHPGTKFNNCPLVKFPVVRPTISPLPPNMTMPIIRPAILKNSSRHRLVTNTQQISSSTTLPTYQQVQEIERGISLDEAIHSTGAINIADNEKRSAMTETECIQVNNSTQENN